MFRSTFITLIALTAVNLGSAGPTSPKNPPPTSAPITSQPTPRDVSELIRPIREKHQVPGMVAAIVEDGRVVALGANGIRQHDHPEKVTINDVFHLGSCTKAMTATMLATLIEEGRLKWDTTVGEVFTELKNRIDPQWKDVTLKQLLCHRSGAPADLSADGLWGRLWSAKGTPTEQRMMLVQGVITHPPVSPPGSTYLYANAGFAIAGAMAERVTGQSWEDLMGSRLFEPLGMTSAGFGAPGSVDQVDQPRGHRADGQAIVPGLGSDNPAAIGPAGTAHCTIGDWAKFITLHLDAERGRPRLLSPDSFAVLHTPYDAPGEPHYGMGWVHSQRDWAKACNPNGRVFMHNGSNNMWFCVTWIAPGRDHDFAVLTMCNQGGTQADKVCDEVSWALIQDELKYLPVARQTPPRPPDSLPARSPSSDQPKAR